jgi:hypothetical protein
MSKQNQNTDIILCDGEFVKNILHYDFNNLSDQQNIDKFDFIKLKNFVFQRTSRK